MICEAIDQRHILELRYHGYSRIVEPHIYGEDRHGNEVLRCYQLAGGSASGERAGWKLLYVQDAVLVHLTETEFMPRADYRVTDKVVVNAYCRIGLQNPAQQDMADHRQGAP
ncbi:hypothetical protein [Noviherbaspirillum humi]|nr:hypothetical protein [Noviherbaspirillum humi]